MNIIEKVGIKRLEPFSTVDIDGHMKYRFNDVSKMQSEWMNMIDCLIDLVINGINDKYNEIPLRHSRSRSDEWLLRHSEDFFEREINLIESISGKTWEEVKELI